MSAEPATRLIERQRLDSLLATSRADTPFAHTVRRPRTPKVASDRQPSALRGLVFLVGAALILRALFGLFY